VGPEEDQAHAFKTLEYPAQGGPIGRLFELVGDRLASGGELPTQPVLGKAVDQQTQQVLDRFGRARTMTLFRQSVGYVP
jgi:hypothetical protein